MQIESLLKDAAQAMGLPGLQLDNQFCGALLFDEDLCVELRHDAHAGVMCLCAVIGAVPDTTRAQVERQLLQANLFPDLLGDAQFAIEPTQHDLTLCRTLDLEHLDGPGLAQALGQMVGVGRHWRGELVARGGLMA